MTNCKGFDVSEAFSIQPGCFDWASFGVAVVACVIAIITCFYTIRMYFYVKKQLYTANEQLEKQKTENETNEKYRKQFMIDTKDHVDQIKNQILVDSLAAFIEKKHKFIYHFEELFILLTNNETFLLREREDMKEAERLAEERNYYEGVIGCIKDVEYYLGFLNDMIVAMDNNGDNTRKKST